MCHVPKVHTSAFWAGGFHLVPVKASIVQFEECLQHGSVGALINGYDTSNTGGDFNYYITEDWWSVDAEDMRQQGGDELRIWYV